MSSVFSRVSSMGFRAEGGVEERNWDSGGDPEKNATRLSRSVARRLDCGLARAPRLAFEVVIAGSVAEDRSSLGRLLLGLLGDESRLCIRWISVEMEVIVLMLVVNDGLARSDMGLNVPESSSGSRGGSRKRMGD